MSISLKKGQCISLAKEAPKLKKVLVGLGWDEAKKKGLFGITKSLDLDASAIVLRDGVLRNDADVVYYSHLKSMDGSIKHHGDNLTGAGDGDDEQITVKLDKMDADVTNVVFVVNIYNAKIKRQTFANVDNAFIRMVDKDTGKELCRYDISSGSIDDARALIFAELYKCDGEWKFRALGDGSSANSIAELANKYRVVS